MSGLTLTTSRTEHVRPGLIALLGLLAVLGPLTIDLYLPAFPQIQDELSSTPAQVQLTLSAATLGFAVGQLVVGPWSDTVGRRRPLLIATAVHVVASIAIAAAPDITWLIVLRVLQGAGAAGSGVVATALIRDVAEGRHLIRGLARIALFTGIAPVIAPFLGAQLMAALDWRGLFVVVAVYGMLILLASIVWIPETLAVEHRFDPSDRRAVWRSYRILLGNRRFVGIALIGGLMVSSVFAYLSSSSFLFQNGYGMSPQQYGAISAANAVAFVVGTQLSAYVAQRLSPRRVLGAVLPSMALTGFSLGVIAQHSSGVAPAVAVMIVFMALAGACGPCLGALGLADHAARAGTAASLLGAANFGLAGVASPVVGAIGITTMTPLGVVMGSAMTIATAALWMLVLRSPRRRG